MRKPNMTGDHIILYTIDSRYSIDLDRVQQCGFSEYLLEYMDREIYQPQESLFHLQELS